MNVLIAMPAYAGMTNETVRSVLRLQAHLLARGATVSTAVHAMAEIARSRNILASLFYENAELTHLLFVDSDMAFDPEVVQRLVEVDKPLVGCIYPKRQINLDAVIAAARTHEDRDLIVASGLEFVIHHSGEALSVDDGLCAVDGVGMGLCLIAREVFTRLHETGRLSQDWSAARGRLKSGPVFGFFDPIATDRGLMAEDLSFCRRWRTLCGGEVFGLADQAVGHVGEMTFRGRFIDALEAHRLSRGD
ncbi:MAG: hypothetical protein WDM92_00420 [Caulobacteraceae bacterium]